MIKPTLLVLLVALATIYVIPYIATPAHADSSVVSDTNQIWGCGKVAPFGILYPGGEMCTTSRALLLRDSGETNPSNDYYAVKVIVQNQRNPSWPTWISEIWVDVNLPASAQSITYQPQAACTFSAGSISFSVYGIGLSVSVPASCTGYSTSTDSNGLHIHWHQCGPLCGNGNSIVSDFSYSEFAIGFSVPEGAAVPVSVHTGMIVELKTVSSQYYDNVDVNSSLYGCCNGVFPDFGIAADKISLSTPAGTSFTSTVTLTSYNGFAGTVWLGTSITPNVSGGPTSSLTSYAVYLPAGGTATVVLTFSTITTTPQLTYYVQVSSSSGQLAHQSTIGVTLTSPPPPPGYVFPAIFNGIGSQITVCLYSSVSVRITLSAGTTYTGPLDVQIRRDIVWWADDTLTTLSQVVTLYPGNNAISVGSFAANDQTSGDIGAVSQYFIKVFWSGQAIYDPTDPNAREWVKTTYCYRGGGGGSIAHGTAITMADGSNVPVQNLKVGDSMLGYDTATGQFTASKVLAIAKVDTSNMLVIHTTAGTPFRVDANPHQTLWVKAISGTVGWMPVTQIQPGDSLFTQGGWVQVTTIAFAPAGRHVMFDITATMPYFASGYLDPIFKM